MQSDEIKETRVLSKSSHQKCNWNVIDVTCTATVYGMKWFCMYSFRCQNADWFFPNAIDASIWGMIWVIECEWLDGKRIFKSRFNLSTRIYSSIEQLLVRISEFSDWHNYITHHWLTFWWPKKRVYSNICLFLWICNWTLNQFTCLKCNQSSYENSMEDPREVTHTVIVPQNCFCTNQTRFDWMMPFNWSWVVNDSSFFLFIWVLKQKVTRNVYRLCIVVENSSLIDLNLRYFAYYFTF